MKTSKLVAGAMALIVPATVCLTGCSIGLFNTVNYKYEDSDKYTAGDREIDEKVTKVNIDYLSGEVKVKGTDSDTISIKETSNKTIDDDHKVHTWVDDGTLYVRYCASKNALNFTGIEKSLEITLPSAQNLDDFLIHVSSGNTEISGITADSLKSSASSGNVTIDCSAEVIELKASSGNVNLTQSGDNKSIYVKSSSGKVFLTQEGTSGSIKLDSSSGGVTANVDQVSQMDVHVSSGKINIEANNIVDLISKASSGHSDFKLKPAPKTSDIDVSSGGVSVSIPEDSDITVNVSISSGEFNYDLPFTKDGKTYVNGNGSSQMKIHSSSGDVDFFKI